MAAKIRSPIIAVLGHVDHGKTTLLDKIRGTATAQAEPGFITQTIGATRVPISVMHRTCGRLLETLKTELTIPGLLFIDTPGHEAFTTLRKRGGAIADLAVLVVDLNEGFKPQTEESINYLKQFKTPFVVAATKIDRILGWDPQHEKPFCDSFKHQTQRAQDEFEEKLYKLIGQLGTRGFQSERIDRVSDFSKEVVIVPVSGNTGEGIPELLMVLGGIAQKYLKRGLEIKEGEGKGTVLEVKEFRGLGLTLDVILYDGTIKRGDFIIIGGGDVVRTKVRALLEPEPLKELKACNFVQIESVSAAAGIKIAAPDIESVTPGSPIRTVGSEEGVEQAVREVVQEVEEVEIVTDKEGAVLKAETLGGLEALIKSLADRGIPIRKATVGNVTRTDVMEIRMMKDPVIFAFGIKIHPEIRKLAKDNKVWLFGSDVIYTIIEEYSKWKQDEKKRAEMSLLESIVKPGRVRILPGYVFRLSKPAVFGVEIMKGTIKPRYKLKKGREILGEIKELQASGEGVEEAKAGDKVAVSMPDVTINKDASEGDVLDVVLTNNDIEKLTKISQKLRVDERELLEELQST